MLNGAPLLGAGYMELLKSRRKQSKVYQAHQLIGLEIAQLLNDAMHKSLYMRLAKKKDHQLLMALARSVADRKEVRNRGAYFMRLLAESNVSPIKINGKNPRRKQ
jgi:TnpA family transposase